MEEVQGMALVRQVRNAAMNASVTFSVAQLADLSPEVQAELKQNSNSRQPPVAGLYDPHVTLLAVQPRR